MDNKEIEDVLKEFDKGLIEEESKKWNEWGLRFNDDDYKDYAYLFILAQDNKWRERIERGFKGIEELKEMKSTEYANGFEDALNNLLK